MSRWPQQARGGALVRPGGVWHNTSAATCAALGARAQMICVKP